jgi:hypothetical protein
MEPMRESVQWRVDGFSGVIKEEAF